MHFGKTRGTYITIEVPKLKDGYEELNEKVSKRVAEELRKISNLKENDTVLVVGLGNWDITADALGPKVVSNIEITRHLIDLEQFTKKDKAAIFIAPSIHVDAKRYTEWIRFKENVIICPYTTIEFIEECKNKNTLSELINV